MSELLTEAEHEALTLTATLTQAMGAIIGRDGAQPAKDMREVVAHIHGIQQMIMSQAAARAYPDRYRLLGQDLESSATERAGSPS
jgi:hypothetical protein